MQDVSVAVQMATCGIMGPNLVPNNGFEDGTSGWSSWGSYALSVSTGTPSVWEPAEGSQSGIQTIQSAAVLECDRRFYRDIAIPAGAQFMYLSALAGFSGDWYGVDPAIQINGAPVRTKSAGLRYRHRESHALEPDVFVAAVPPGAVIARIACNYKSRCCWWHADAVALGRYPVWRVHMMPLPDSRISCRTARSRRPPESDDV